MELRARCAITPDHEYPQMFARIRRNRHMRRPHKGRNSSSCLATAAISVASRRPICETPDSISKRPVCPPHKRRRSLAATRNDPLWRERIQRFSSSYTQTLGLRFVRHGFCCRPRLTRPGPRLLFCASSLAPRHRRLNNLVTLLDSDPCRFDPHCSATLPSGLRRFDHTHVHRLTKPNYYCLYLCRDDNRAHIHL